MEKYLPYGRHIIDATDKKVIDDVLASDWLTTGPKVAEFEKAWADFCGVREAVAFANGTAALHAAVAVLGLGANDRAVVTPMTFAASANCVAYANAEPLFADVDPTTLLMDPDAVAKLVKKNNSVKAIIPVDYAGQPCDYDAIRASAPGVPIIADACHSPGALYKGRKAGTLGDMTCFSFHPVKHFTTGEGGAVTTDDPGLAKKLRVFRNHGIDSDARERTEAGTWFYDMTSLGFNYRLTDLQCALGLSQMRKLPAWLVRRRELAALYGRSLDGISGVESLGISDDVLHAWHLYIIRIKPGFGLNRDEAFCRMKERNIGVNVHYRPVHLHSYYRKRFGTGPGLCPVAEKAGEEILTLPLWPGMDNADVERVIDALEGARRQ